MKLVQKGNRQLRIQDDRLDAMLAAGYTEVDQKTGKQLKKEPNDAVSALKKENEALKKANKELAEQLEAAKKQNKSAEDGKQE